MILKFFTQKLEAQCALCHKMSKYLLVQDADLKFYCLFNKFMDGSFVSICYKSNVTMVTV